MNVQKIRLICRPIRLVVGAALIAYAIYSGINWFFLGVIPFIAGIINFCPLCKITGECELVGGK